MLFDFYKKAKKKLGETFTPAVQKTRSGFGEMAQKAKKSFFSPSPTATKINRSMQKFSAAAENAPKFNFSQRIKNPVGKFGAEIAQGIFNIPSKAVSTTFKGYGEDYNPFTSHGRSKALKRFGEAAEVGLDIGSLFGGGSTAKGLVKKGFQSSGKNAFRQTVKQGAKRGLIEGTGYGAGYGTTSGLQSEGSSKDKLKQSIKNIPASAAMGGILGGAVGGASPYVGREARNIKDDVAHLMNPYAKRVVMKYDYAPVDGVFVDGKRQLQPIAESGKKVVEKVRLPFEPKSKTFQIITRPGLTIEEKIPSSAKFNKNIAAKNAKASEKVARQLQNQRKGLETAEDGFVSPKGLKAPQKPKSGRIGTDFMEQSDDEFLRNLSEGKAKGPVKTEPPFHGDEFKGSIDIKNAKPMKKVGDLIENRKVMKPEKRLKLENERKDLEKKIWQRMLAGEGKPVEDVMEQIAPLQDQLENVIKKLGGKVPDKNKLLETSVFNYPVRLAQMGYKGNQINQIDFPLAKKIIDDQISPWMFKKWYMETGQRSKVVPKRLESTNFEDLNDITTYSKGFKDIYRNIEKVFGKGAESIKKTLLDPFDRSKGNFIDEQRKWIENLKENVVNKLGIKKGSEESALIQAYGEGKMTLSQLQKEAPEKWQDIVQADKWFRQAYDRILDEVNEVRKQIYPSHPLVPDSDKTIPKRKDYYRHFQEMGDGFRGLLNIFENSAQIDPDLARLSMDTKPKSKWLSFAQKRRGDFTDMDAVGGFLDYLKASSYAKHIDPHIQQFRGLGEELVDKAKFAAQKAKDESLKTKLNNFINYVEYFAKDLGGKTNPMDRALQDFLPLPSKDGRKAFKIINWTNSRVKANTVLGNLSSSIAQFFNIPQGFANAGTGNSLKAVGRTLSNIIRKEKNGAIAQSPFIKERYFDDYAQFDSGILKNTKKFAVWMTQVGDEIGTKFIWNAHFQKALAEGIDDPIKYADDWTRKMVAGRGIGEVPLMQKSKIMQLVAPFQLEVQNQWHVLQDWFGEKQAGKIVKWMIASYLMNQGAKKIRGSDVSFDPLNATIEAINEYRNEGNKKTGLAKAGGRLAGEVFSNVFGGQQAAALYPEYGAKIFGKELPSRSELFGEGDPTRFGASGLIARGVQDPLYKLIPSFGGMQIKRMKEGIGSWKKGYSESSKGQVQFPIEKNAKNLLRSATFGKYSTPEAQEYFDNDQKPLTENQSEKFKLAGKDYYDQVSAERKSNKEKDELKEGKIDSEAGQIQNGIFQLSNGNVYVKSLDREFPTIEKAIAGIKNAEIQAFKDEFSNSDENYMEYNGRIYRKSENGEISSMSKDKYTSLIYKQQMEQQKREKNLEGWLGSAQELYGVYEKMMQDPSVDELEKITIQNDMATLSDQLEKYQGYGGFSKPKSAGAAANKAISTAISLGNAKLSSLKARDDFSSWRQEALNQINQLAGMASDSSLSELQRAKLQSKIDSLQSQYVKYEGYGGFTKQKKSDIEKEAKKVVSSPRTDPTLVELALMRAFGGSNVPAAPTPIFTSGARGSVPGVSRRRGKIIRLRGRFA